MKDPILTQMQLDDLLSDYMLVSEWAELHGMRSGTVRVLIDRGQINGVVKIGKGTRGLWFVPIDATIDYTYNVAHRREHKINTALNEK